MKKCIHCGREIPDEAKFCGFCGTLQPETEDKNTTVSIDSGETEKEPETAPVSEELTEKPAEAEDQSENTEKPEVQTEDTEKEGNSDSSDTEGKTEENESESSEPSENVQIVEEADSDSGDQTDSPEKDEHEIKDAEIVEPVSDEKESPEKEEKPAEKESEPETEKNESSDNTGKETTEKSAEEPKNTESDQKEETAGKKEKKKPHVDLKKISLPKINVSSGDFGVLLDLLKEPEKRQGINNTTTWIILIFAWIANWIAFGSFWRGFISLLIVMIGLILINWLTLKDHATFGETVRNSAEVVFAPSLLVLIGGLFVRNIVVGAEIYSFHSIFTTAFIGLFFLTAALILFVLTIIRRYEMKSWEMVWILTMFVALLTWYLITGGAIPLLS